MSFIYSGWVSVTLGIQHAMRLHHIAVCGLAPLYNIFPHYLINSTFFEKTLVNTKCLFRLSLQLLSETFLILRIIQRDNIKNISRSSRELPFILDRFKLELWIFCTGFWTILRYEISWKYVRWYPSRFMRTDRRDEASIRYSRICDTSLKAGTN